MLDIKYIREHTEEVKQNGINRKAKADVDAILTLDDQRKELQTTLDSLRQELNASSKQKPTPEMQQVLREKSSKIKELEIQLASVQKDLHAQMAWVPNVSSPNMPIGKGEEDNVELKAWTPKDGYLGKEKLGKGDNAAQYMPVIENGMHHVELGENLDIIDTKQSALTSGSRFTYLKKEAVLLQYGIFELLKNKLLSEEFIPMIPPLLVKEEILFGTSHFPEGRDQVYQIEKTNIENNQELFLVGSSEPPLFAYYMEKTLNKKDLPAKMFALTTCFRSEVGSWGKDVRGIKRVHQFDKLEMDVVCSSEQSSEVMQQLLSINEWLLQSLQIPYRVVNKCTGDAGYLASYEQYDVETWLPGQKEFMEVMTDTNATDYQARRLKIKYRDGEKTFFAHTVNDTGCAMGRMIIAILDNYQQSDGSVRVPEVLQKYVGKSIIHNPINK